MQRGPSNYEFVRQTGCATSGAGDSQTDATYRRLEKWFSLSLLELAHDQPRTHTTPRNSRRVLLPL